jgi:hypothetical protein
MAEEITRDVLVERLMQAMELHQKKALEDGATLAGAPRPLEGFSRVSGSSGFSVPASEPRRGREYARDAIEETLRAAREHGHEHGRGNSGPKSR